MEVSKLERIHSLGTWINHLKIKIMLVVLLYVSLLLSLSPTKLSTITSDTKCLLMLGVY